MCKKMVILKKPLELLKVIKVLLLSKKEQKVIMILRKHYIKLL